MKNYLIFCGIYLGIDALLWLGVMVFGTATDADTGDGANSDIFGALAAFCAIMKAIMSWLAIPVFVGYWIFMKK